MLNYFSSFFKTPFINAQERKKFVILSGIFFFIIGVYWLLRPIKDGVFFTIVGKNYQPMAKILSFVVVGLLVLVYSKLVDKLSRHKLLSILACFYATAIAAFAYFLLDPQIGMANLQSSPDRLIGWLWYFFVESFGTIMIGLFWSFVSDTTNSESAARCYFTVALCGQSGGFVMPFIAQYMTTNGALCIGVFGLFMMLVGVFLYIKLVPEHERVEKIDVKKPPLEGAPKTGFLEGLRLLLVRPYLLGIFTFIAIYEIIITMIDYRFKILASEVYAGEALVSYLFKYAIYANLVAVVALVFGIGSLGRRLGVTKTLLLFPFLIVGAFLVLTANPVLPVAFAIMVTCKGINFALMQPAKEQLYIPTSKESRYKAKAWIDMFGLRTSKGIGSSINNFREVLGVEFFMWMSVLLSIGLAGIWLLAVMFVGKIHAKAVKEDRMIC